MNSRWLAIALTLFIGSPTCWCCVPAAAHSPAAEHSCCAGATEDSQPSAPAGHRNSPCPCATSVLKRELAEVNVDLPQPVVTGSIPPFALALTAAEAFPVVVRRAPCLDTGPPYERPPLYLQQHALLM